MKKRGWRPAPEKRLTVPDSNVAPITFFLPGSSVPGCGLLVDGPGAVEFIDILTPAADEEWPYCAGINDVASFEMNGKRHLVFEYLNRDSRDEFYREFFFIVENQAGKYLPNDVLNKSTAAQPPKAFRRLADVTPDAAEGMRLARLASLVPGMELMGRDLITERDRTFAIFHNKVAKECVFATAVGHRPARFGHALFSDGDVCAEVLGSSRFEKNGNSYYLGLFKGARKNHLAVVVVNRDNEATAHPDLARAIAATPLQDLRVVRRLLAQRIK